MERLPALLLFAFSSSFTPGPNNVMILTSGLNYGVARSLPHLCGIAFGFVFMVAMLGLGLGFLFTRFPLLHEAIKLGAVLYLLFLAWRIATTRAGGLEGAKREPLNFVQAALFQWLNPKAWMMGTSGIATFTTAAGDAAAEIALICAVFLFASFIGTGSWLVFGAALKRVLSQPRHRRLFNRVMAVLLVLSVLPVALEFVDTHLLSPEVRP